VTRETKDDEDILSEPDDTLPPPDLGGQAVDRFGLAEALRGLVPDEPPLESEPEVELPPPTLPDATETMSYRLYQDYRGGLSGP
jgi:hypothetical protein